MIGPLPYIGGKRRLAPQIVKLLPPHVTYVEAFAGGAQVFFHKPPSVVEVLNDMDGEIVNFLRVVQQHGQELVRWLRPMAASRALHRWFSKQDPIGLTDIQRAARFLYLQKNSFGGRVTRQSFNVGITSRPNYSPARLPHIIAGATARLESAQIESSPYQKMLDRFDRPTTLFYLDPPYLGRSLYRLNFSDDEFRQMVRRLKTLKGRFVLSINDHPLSRELIGEFCHRTLALSYTASRTVPQVSEFVFANYDLGGLPDLSRTSTEM